VTVLESSPPMPNPPPTRGTTVVPRRFLDVRARGEFFPIRCARAIRVVDVAATDMMVGLNSTLDYRFSARRAMPSNVLLEWLSRLSGISVDDETSPAFYDGRAMCLCARVALTGDASRGDGGGDDDDDVDWILNLQTELSNEGLESAASLATRCLRERDARGAMRVLREIYAEHLCRRVQAFSLERTEDGEPTRRFSDATPKSSASRRSLSEKSTPVRSESGEEEDQGCASAPRDLMGAFEASGWMDENCDETDEDALGELDLTSDWTALEKSPVPKVQSPTGVGFVRASDMLRELDVNDLAAVPASPSPRSERMKKTLTRTPDAVPKKLSLVKERSSPRAPTRWDIVFDEPKATQSMPKWYPGSREASSPRPRSENRRNDEQVQDVVSWLGERDERHNLQRAAERRGRLTSSLSPGSRNLSPERRKSFGGTAACYVPARTPSNKRIIRNALRLLVGPTDSEAYCDVVAAVNACSESSVVILFKGFADVGPRKMRGMYAVEDGSANLKRIYGNGPDVIGPELIAGQFKYDTVSMNFVPLSLDVNRKSTNATLAPTVAAISLARGLA